MVEGRHVRNVLHVAVFGGNGFLGRHIIHRLAQYPNLRIWSFDKREHNVIIDTSKAKGIVEQVAARAEDEFSQAFLCGNQMDIIIYCAGYESPTEGLNDRFVEDSLALAGLSKVLRGVEAMINVSDSPVKPFFLYVSSWSVYGKNKKRPFKEDDTPAPLNHSGMSKVLGEDLVKRFCTRLGVRYCIVRPTEVFGKREHNELLNPGFFPGFFAHYTDMVVRQESEIPVYSPDTQIDLISVNHFTKVIDKILINRSEGIFNICSGKTISLGGLVTSIIDLHGSFSGRVIPKKNVKLTNMLVDHSRVLTELQIEYDHEKYDLDYFLMEYIKVRRYEIANSMAIERALKEPVTLDMTTKEAQAKLEQRKLERLKDYQRIADIAGDQFERIKIGNFTSRAKELGVSPSILDKDEKVAIDLRPKKEQKKKSK